MDLEKIYKHTNAKQTSNQLNDIQKHETRHTIKYIVNTENNSFATRKHTNETKNRTDNTHVRNIQEPYKHNTRNRKIAEDGNAIVHETCSKK